MRLTDIKLAGFKSFVDPTHVPIPGQLVGIVGPNGCGKSNITDAVRWVLGESQAKHLRGETMQDVIFNGSGERAPVSRASVELIFDNSLGKAVGQWSSYAEISIKRVLQRNGESSYYINNTHVRRRDITDIFLGTGLGPRAYAIIEQGMISRVIEARPEELRVFLEEAAGVSKYRERRHETELRLKDTRENLLRVADVRQELEKQLQHLEEQARMASHYRDLQAQLQVTQNLLWLLKAQDAAANRNRIEKEIQKTTSELEAETAKLRETEKNLEQVRTGHYSAGDALHHAQGELYSANAEVARLEQQLQHIRENRQRLEAQSSSLRSQQLQLETHRKTGQQTLAQLRDELGKAQERGEKIRSDAGNIAELLPALEQKFRECQDRAAELQRNLAQVQQAAQVEDTHRIHALRMLEQLQARHDRLLDERNSLPKPASADLQRVKDQQALKTSELDEKQEKLESLQQLLPELEQAQDVYSRRLQTQERASAASAARLDTLKQLQERLLSEGRLQPWLAKHGLDSQPRLWRDVHIEAGWENAFESVLGERLNALALGGQDTVRCLLEDVPPVRLTVFTLPAQNQAAQYTHPEEMRPLSSLMSSGDTRVRALLEDWLCQVYAAESAPLQLREQLSPGAMLVTREGHIFTRYSVSFHAAGSKAHGMLARNREIEQLEEKTRRGLKALEDDNAALDIAQEKLRDLQVQMSSLRAAIEGIQEEHHRLQLEALKLDQSKEQTEHRAEQILRELKEIHAQQESETQQQKEAENKLAGLRLQMGEIEDQVLAADSMRQGAESELNAHRAKHAGALQVANEAEFNAKAYVIRISDIEVSFKVLDEQREQLRRDMDNVEGELRKLQASALQEQLQRALQAKQNSEQGVSLARDALEGAARILKQTDEERLGIEAKLAPLRDRINALRLKQQEARLNEAQYREQLGAANVEELNAMLQKGAKIGSLQGEIARLEREITALGAVNLAALEELQSATERKIYLDGQAGDLETAVATLENAIRRIDRETRARLMDTFDAINRHLDEMFPMLFGGGKARLVLSGEEVLDSGVQVIAQPPGKKNTTIHLLSGGEKALVALALIFALFQLNPAPFCMLDEVDAPLDDTNTESFCKLLRKMSEHTQFVFISHNKITMEIAHQLIGVTMQELGVSRVVAVDIEEAMKLREEAVA